MFLGPHKMKMSHYFQSLIPSGTWDFFDLRRSPPSNFWTFSSWKLGFFDLLTTPPPPPTWNRNKVSPLSSLESFPYTLMLENLNFKNVFFCDARVGPRAASSSENQECDPRRWYCKPPYCPPWLLLVCLVAGICFASSLFSIPTIDVNTFHTCSPNI